MLTLGAIRGHGGESRGPAQHFSGAFAEEFLVDKKKVGFKLELQPLQKYCLVTSGQSGGLGLHGG